VRQQRFERQSVAGTISSLKWVAESRERNGDKGMVTFNRKSWRSLVLTSDDRRSNSTVDSAVRKAAQQGGLSDLEALLDLIENRKRRLKHDRSS
jgi:hypothetical protein